MTMRISQVNVIFTIKQGPQARVGNVGLQGKDPGISVPEFRKKGKLDCNWFSTLANKLILRDCNAKVTRDTTSTALAGVRKYYQKRDRLEGTISQQSETYAPPRKQLDYQFLANQGPIVNITIEGAKISKDRKKLLVPIYEESTVDRDLVNEGAFNIRDYMQRKGYFDAEDSVRFLGRGTSNVTVQYTVNPGKRHTVRSVNIEGNKYFSDSLIQQQLRVKKADLYVRSGTYSTQLVENDRSAIEALYRSSGFTHVKVTSAVKDTDKTSSGQALKVAIIDVTYTIDEGEQQKFGEVDLSGVGASRQDAIKALLSAETGQPFSLITLSNDRDAVLSYYLAHGFDLAEVEIQQQPDPDNKDRINVAPGGLGRTPGHDRSCVCSPVSCTRNRQLCSSRYWCMRRIRWTRPRYFRRNGTSTTSRSSTRSIRRCRIRPAIRRRRTCSSSLRRRNVGT